MPGQRSTKGSRARGSWLSRLTGIAIVVVLASGGTAAYLLTVHPKQVHPTKPLPTTVVSVQTVGLVAQDAAQQGSSGQLASAIGEANVLRVIFFVLTFFSIGVMSNFRQLWQDGFGKLAAVYIVSLFGFVVWVGFVISWLFFAGAKPPLAS